jgi:hypothetical protein
VARATAMGTRRKISTSSRATPSPPMAVMLIVRPRA